MLVSVVVATYDGEKFIEEQLQTLNKQTYRPDEVIISDDGSKDKTINVVEEFISKNNLHRSWKVKQNEKNKGYAQNFLDSAMDAKGDVVFFCDQDDIWKLDKIKSMIEVMEEKTDIDVLASNLQPFYFEENTRKWDDKKIEEMKLNDSSIDKVMFDKMNFHLKRSGCTMAVRKEFLQSIMPYWVDKWAHDDFVWKLALANNKLAILQKITLDRRMHSNNATVIRKRSRKWRINQLQEVKTQLEAYLEYTQNITINNKSEKITIISENIKSLNIRLDLIEKKKIWNWGILLFKYKDCYPRIKGLYLDLYLTLIHEYRGA